MAAEAPAFTASWRVGQRTCTLSVPRLERGRRLLATTEWAPTKPRSMTAAEIEQYVRGRDRALRDLAAALQISVAVIDL